MAKHLIRTLLVTLALWHGFAGAEAETVRANGGIVVSGAAPASEAGANVLEQGGNAFDAAAATGFALAVTRPSAGNLGGGGFLVGVTADGQAHSLDFRETAPGNAHRDMFLDETGQVIPGASLSTILASGTPGSPMGLLEMWEQLGSGNISRRELIAPAIRLASEGFALSDPMAARLNRYRDYLGRDSAARAVFLRSDGRPWRQGDVLVQKDLARTLERIAESGAEGFYAGTTASALAAYMRNRNGLISEQDLAAYSVNWREPVRVGFQGFELVSMPPPSSGGLLLGMMLNMLKPHDLHALGWQSADYIHLLTGVQRRAYADRARHMGDTGFWDVPMRGLLSMDYARARMQTFSFDRATPSSEVSAGAPARYESKETTHYSVADVHGNAAAVTVTLNASFGSGLMAPGTGFLLNNEMDDFSAKPGVPNLYGVTGGEANAIEPGKRMLSSMSPTIVLQDGKPRYVLGSPGGSTIPTTVLQVFLNAAVFGMSIEDAVAAPRHHSQWLPDRIVYEDGTLPEAVLAQLRRRGHAVIERSDTVSIDYIGVANCVEITEDGFIGAPDMRSDSHAAGAPLSE